MQHKKLLVFLFLIGAFVFSSCLLPTLVVQIDEDWPTSQRTLEQVSSLIAEVNLPLKLSWRISIGSKAATAPILAFGHLFVGSSDGMVFAIDPRNGNVVYSTDLNGAVAGLAAAPQYGDFPGAILVTTERNGSIYALRPLTGEILWRREDGYGVAISPPIVYNAKGYYMLMADESTPCIRAVSVNNGSTYWQKCDGYLDEIFGPPILFAEGTLFYSGHPSVTNNFNAETGDPDYLDWGFVGYNITPWYDFGIFDRGAIDVPHGRFILRDHDYGIVAYTWPPPDLPGYSDWSIDLPQNSVLTGMAITQNRDPNILVVSQQDYLYCLNADTGALLAQTQTPRNGEWIHNHRTPQPVIWGDYVFHITDGTHLKAYDLNDLSEEWSYDLEGQTLASPIASGNTMFIATMGGKVFALTTP